MKTFHLNGERHTTLKKSLSYEDIEGLAFKQNPSVTYKMSNGASGILTKGDRILIGDGLKISAHNTGNA